MAVSPVPPGFHTVTPHLVLRGAGKAIEFYKKAFGATEVMIMPGPDGKGVMHAEIKIGDSIIFLADEWPGGPQASPEKYGGTTVSIHLYVANCDATFNQAVAAGAKAEMPPMDMFWGDRFGKVIDPFGHSWSIAQHVEDVPPEEMGPRMKEWMKNMPPMPKK
jgi:PhnB protein